MKVNLLCKNNLLPGDFDVLPYDEESDLVLSDANISISNWGHVRTGRLTFPLHRSIELGAQHSVEFEDGETKEILFTRVHATGEHLRVDFKIKKTA